MSHLAVQYQGNDRKLILKSKMSQKLTGLKVHHDDFNQQILWIKTPSEK